MKTFTEAEVQKLLNKAFDAGASAERYLRHWSCGQERRFEEQRANCIKELLTS